jgi:polar amino acid transport system substrate-binding protein
MMRSVLSIVCGMLFILFSCNVFAQSKKKISLACNEFPPHKMENSPDGLLGFDVDILKRIFDKMDFDLSITYFPWKRALANTKASQVDGLCSCSKSREREGWLLYSDQLGTVGIGYFHPKSFIPPVIWNKKTAKNVKVAVVRGYVLSKDLHDRSIQFMNVNGDETGMKMLLNDRIGAFYTYRDTGNYFLSKMKNAEDIQYTEVREAPYYTCFRKNLPDGENILRQFNEELILLHESGEYERIKDHYR